MMVFKRKQIVVLSLALILVIAAYLQYSYKKSSISASSKDTGKIGEAVYVNENTASDAGSNNSKVSAASKQVNDFFVQAKLDREITRSKDADTLKEIADDTSASKDARNKASEQMLRITSNSDKEMRIESLIKQKGYEDAVAFFGDDTSLDIVVKAPKLTEQDVAKIADVASRQANISIDKIVIKGMWE